MPFPAPVLYSLHPCDPTRQQLVLVDEARVWQDPQCTLNKSPPSVSVCVCVCVSVCVCMRRDTLGDVVVVVVLEQSRINA